MAWRDPACGDHGRGPVDAVNAARLHLELHHPDVILLDLHLPDLPGEEVHNRLQAEAATRDIPVIVVSADATARSIRRLRARGVSGYLTKPVNLRELRELITATIQPRVAAGPRAD